MKRSIIPFIVRRYLRFDPSQPFISIAAILAFLGVAVGVMVLIVAMAIMNGFDRDFHEKLFVMNYPITILPRYSDSIDSALVEQLRVKFPKLKFSPYLQAGAMSRKGSLMEGNIVFGVDFEAERLVNSVIDRALKQRSYEPFDAIAGKSLLDRFGTKEGEKLLMIFTRVQPAGLALMPMMKRFTIAGSFESGLIAYDKAYFYTQIDDLRATLALEPNRLHGIHVGANDPMSVIDDLQAELGESARAVGWWEQNSNFFSALALEKRALFLVLMLIILVAALNIISSLMMTVLNRRKEIALLIALGAKTGEIEKIFFTIGCAIGAGGIVIGAVLGGAALWTLGNFDIISLPADVYGTSRLPLELSMTDFASIVLGAFVIVLLSAWYPAHKAGKTDPLDTLRHE
ncbi:permease [Campylobacterota bacterium]|nr:permease [Campylobacterota bacterium]